MPKEDYMLTRIFRTIYKKYTQQEISIKEYKKFEETLKNAVLDILGYKIYSNYNAYISGQTGRFDYFNEVSKLFENIICNYNKSESIVNHIESYSRNYDAEIEKYRYAGVLLRNIYRLYSLEQNKVILLKFGDCYRVDPIDDGKGDVPMPSIYIDNIADLDNILKKYLEAIINTDNNYKRIFDNEIVNSPEDIPDNVLSDIFCFTMLNMSNVDVRSLEEFFKKYTDFVNDDIFDMYKGRATYLGEVFDDKIYVNATKKDLAYETPYWLAFMFENSRYICPLVGVGIDSDNNKKVAEVVAIQDSQSIPWDINQHKMMMETIKRKSPKSPNFREHSPSHLISIILSIGFLRGAGIEKVNVNEYMPFRYKRLILERHKSDDDINSYQKRVTSKNVFTWLRMLEFTNDINIDNYPDNGMFLTLSLNDEIKFNDELFQQLYDLGYKAGLETKLNNDMQLKKGQ